jgi:sulfatase maturation enzyme AslB (radical SAM superfamily)
MSNEIYCPMIHGGLNVNMKRYNSVSFNQCCLSSNFLNESKVDWNHKQLQDIRELNDKNVWHPGCWECERLEKVGIKSFRHSMIEKFGIKKNLPGPQRIDLLFDRSCNLACRTCGPESSTFWNKHLKDNNLKFSILDDKIDNLQTIHNTLESLDLSNLGMVQFCGGETLMGKAYWEVAKKLTELIPNAKQNIELGFQTNGTQTIDTKHYETIEKFKLVKFLISIDGINDRFEYLRWPANWNQVVDNIMNLREKLPSNVMFFVQECTSCLNMFYFGEVADWVSKNFNANREGDRTDHSTQLAGHPYLNVDNITQEYADALKGTKIFDAIDTDWQEDPARIRLFLTETKKFDLIRGQDWTKTFPEVADFYSRYL